ncbi:MAG: hypothetical protein LBI31_02255 [Zoogloeaceae bacterium]|jgi:hypothetical protein|nr:hypothetical protein [Zoogloeaceae bacterium]
MKKGSADGRMMKWVKKGRVAVPETPGFQHNAMVPHLVHMGSDDFVIAFARKDMSNRSHIFLMRAVITNGSITVDTPKLALSPGVPGSFDCDGVLAPNFVRDGGNTYLYYGSWQNLPNKMWMMETGRAVFDPETLSLKKEFPGPVSGRSFDEPFWAGAPWVLKEGNLWRRWYVSLDRWESIGDGFRHYYCIKHRYSEDGIHWKSPAVVAIPHANEYEYAIAAPCVIHVPGELYRMWYSFRGQKDVETYRIGYAESEDGLQWQRLDHLAGITVSDSGWDAEMVCYSRVFSHRGITYMFYNGNGYGKTGFGMAVLEEG